MKTKSRPEAQLIFAASESDANLLYATRFFAPDPVIFFIHGGRKYMVMSDLEIDRARQQAQVHSVLSLSAFEKQLRRKKAKVADPAAVLALVLNSKSIRRVEVPYSFPTGLAEELKRQGLRVTVKKDPFFETREVKQPFEIVQIRQAQRAAEAGMEMAMQILREARIRPGGALFWQGTKLTSEVLKRRIDAAILERGGIASHTIAAGGDQGCDPHNEGRGPLKAHQPIILDIFPRMQKSGYWGDITRTVVKGKASDRLKEQFHTVLRGQQLALKQLRAGVCGNEIHQSVVDFFEGEGFPTGSRNGRMHGFFHGTGHGVGLEIHEAPRLGPKGTAPLKAGHMVTVEPGLYYPGVGGVRIEDLVVVTRDGIRNLTRFPKYLEIP